MTTKKLGFDFLSDYYDLAIKLTISEKNQKQIISFY